MAAFVPVLAGRVGRGVDQQMDCVVLAGRGPDGYGALGAAVGGENRAWPLRRSRVVWGGRAGTLCV